MGDEHGANSIQQAIERGKPFLGIELGLTRIMAAAMNAPSAVMETAGEGEERQVVGSEI